MEPFLCLSLFNKIMSKDFSKHTKSNLEINCKQMLLSQQLFLSSSLHLLIHFVGIEAEWKNNTTIHMKVTNAIQQKISSNITN